MSIPLEREGKASFFKSSPYIWDVFFWCNNLTVCSHFDFRMTQHSLETIFSMWPGDLHAYHTLRTDLSGKLSSLPSSVDERSSLWVSWLFWLHPWSILEGLLLVVNKKIWGSAHSLLKLPSGPWHQICLSKKWHLTKSLICNGILSKSYNGTNLPDWFGGILRQYRNHGLHRW